MDYRKIASSLTNVGLAIYAGAFLFGAGSLTVLGWVVMVPIFAGCTFSIAHDIYSLLPEREEVDGDEKNKTKAQATA